MSVITDVLLVDIGNSRIKYALFKRQQPTTLEINVCHHASALEPAIRCCDKMLVASVGEPGHLDVLGKLAERAGITWQRIVPSASAFGITCAYQQYETLGIDRWLVILAARFLTQQPVAIIDAGTAVTCDIVVANEHRGGWIAPGYQVMREALLASTSNVFSDNYNPQHLALGATTQACVNQGCLASLQGVYVNARKLLQEFGEDYQIYICGGDASLFHEFVDEKTQIKRDLVMLGLSRFA